jgi:hypothetical protein
MSRNLRPDPPVTFASVMLGATQITHTEQAVLYARAREPLDGGLQTVAGGRGRYR